MKGTGANELVEAARVEIDRLLKESGLDKHEWNEGSLDDVDYPAVWWKESIECGYGLHIKADGSVTACDAEYSEPLPYLQEDMTPKEAVQAIADLVRAFESIPSVRAEIDRLLKDFGLTEHEWTEGVHTDLTCRPVAWYKESDGYGYGLVVHSDGYVTIFYADDHSDVPDHDLGMDPEAAVDAISDFVHTDSPYSIDNRWK